MCVSCLFLYATPYQYRLRLPSVEFHFFSSASGFVDPATLLLHQDRGPPIGSHPLPRLNTAVPPAQLADQPILHVKSRWRQDNCLPSLFQIIRCCSFIGHSKYYLETNHLIKSIFGTHVRADMLSQVLPPAGRLESVQYGDRA